MRGKHASIAVSLCIIGGCGSLSKANRFSDPPRTTVAALAGDRAHRDLERRFGGRCDDPAAIDRMQRVADRLGIEALAANGATELRFYLLGTQRYGAYSLPDGRVYVTKGLYQRLHSDALLAAVLAHEIAHIREQDGYHPTRSERDCVAREMSADQYAIRRLIHAGFDPESMVEVLDITRAEQKSEWYNRRVLNLQRLTSEGPFALRAVNHRE